LANTKRMTIRTLALTLDQLMETNAQLELWEAGLADGPMDGWTGDKAVGRYGGRAVWQRSERTALQAAIDQIRTRYGSGAVKSPLSAHRTRLPVTT
jgi:hypothetical protein